MFFVCVSILAFFYWLFYWNQEEPRPVFESTDFKVLEDELDYVDILRFGKDFRLAPMSS